MYCVEIGSREITCAQQLLNGVKESCKCRVPLMLLIGMTRIKRKDNNRRWHGIIWAMNQFALTLTLLKGHSSDHMINGTAICIRNKTGTAPFPLLWEPLIKCSRKSHAVYHSCVLWLAFCYWFVWGYLFFNFIAIFFLLFHFCFLIRKTHTLLYGWKWRAPLDL